MRRGRRGGSDKSSLSLEELIARQRVNLNQTFAFERDPSIGEAAVMRLATFEEELADATEEFSAGLNARERPGAGRRRDTCGRRLPRWMGSSLPPPGPTKKALKWLISARNNVLKLLSQGNSSQASACRQFDRQQVQRIRRPRKASKLARPEEDLLELANANRRSPEEIEALGGGCSGRPAAERAKPASSEPPPPEPAKSSADAASTKL